jgi:predicted RNase H-like nuclease (RuvC/YqgF family)
MSKRLTPEDLEEQLMCVEEEVGDHRAGPLRDHIAALEAELAEKDRQIEALESDAKWLKRERDLLETALRGDDE